MPDTPNIDIRPDHWRIVRDILRKHVPQYPVWAFGSRAKWTAKQYSDLDLAVITDQPLPLDVSAALADDFSESDLPWKVDVVDWATTSESFRKIIERDRVVVQKKEGRAAEWRETTLSEICRQQGGSIQTGPFGSQLHASDYAVSGTPVVMPVNLIDGNIDEQGIARISDAHVERLARHKLKPSDIVFSRRGDVTRFVLASEREAGWLCGTGCLKVSMGKSSIAIPDFIAAVLDAPDTKEWLIRHAVGATMPNLNTEILGAIPIALPSIDVQKEIGTFLDELKARIDNLRQTNATLEAIAQALFKSWFVDFDGVLAQDMQQSELGLIPKGWSVRSLDSIADYLNGLALQKFPPDSETEFLPVIKIAQLRAGNADSADKASTQLKSEYIVEDGDVLFSWSGSLEVEVWTGGRGALNQHLFKITSREVPKWFYYFATRQHLPDFRAIAAGKATTMGHIQRGHLAAAKVVVPPSEAMSGFNAIIAPLFEQKINNAIQAKTLAQLRDTLLPRLISGQLRIKEADCLLEEVV